MIEFRFEHKDIYTQGNTVEISYKVKKDGDIHDLMQEFRQFLLAIGYQPKTISQYIPED